MRFALLLILQLALKNPHSIIVSAHLVDRHAQGGALGNWDLGDLFWDGFTFLDGVGKSWQDSQDSGSSDTNPRPDNRQPSTDSPEAAPASPPSSNTFSPAGPVYKLDAKHDQSSSQDDGANSVVLPSVINEECDLMNTNDPDCGTTTDQLIFTSSCASIDPNQVVSAEAGAQNQAIREALVLMNDQNILAKKGGQGIRESMFDTCGVYFFAVPLTQKQIHEVEQKLGVLFVRPNQALHVEGNPGNSDPEDTAPAAVPVLTAPGNQLHERSEIVEDRDAWEDLRYISTPRLSELSSAYYYDSNAGQEVTVIAVDHGVNRLHNQFIANNESPLLPDEITAMDYLGPPLDDDFGTCRTSKIVGSTFGVARKAKAKVVNIAPTVSSLMDAFLQVARYLLAKIGRKEKVKGYHVMSFMTQWDDTDPTITSRLEELLDLLRNSFQLVVVVPAGMDPLETNAVIDMWPATVAQKFDLIVVGGVTVGTGKTYLFSRGGPLLSVNAPGNVKCAGRRGAIYILKRGTDVATTQVAGLVAYLLSLQDIGPLLRRNPQIIPLRVKAFLMNTASYTREGGDFPSIWNLLGASS